MASGASVISSCAASFLAADGGAATALVFASGCSAGLDTGFSGGELDPFVLGPVSAANGASIISSSCAASFFGAGVGAAVVTALACLAGASSKGANTISSGDEVVGADGLAAGCGAGFRGVELDPCAFGAASAANGASLISSSCAASFLGEG